jgi:hypothetical protein
MARTTGPILAAGAITAFTGLVVYERPIMNFPRVAVATGIAAGGLFLMEKAWPDGATALAWMALLTVLLVRVEPGTPAPAEAVANWLQAIDKGVNQ